MKPKPTTGRAVKMIAVRPRSSAQRDCLGRAAKKAGVALSYYLLESALMVAAEEGFTPRGVQSWRPGRKGEPMVVATEPKAAFAT